MSSKSSKTEREEAVRAERDDLPESVAVGRVLRPHGVRGEVVIEVLSDVPGRFQPGSRVQGIRPGKPPLALTVATGRPHKSGAVVRFAGCEAREAAEALRGLDLEVPRAEVPRPRRAAPTTSTSCSAASAATTARSWGGSSRWSRTAAA